MHINFFNRRFFSASISRTRIKLELKNNYYNLIEASIGICVCMCTSASVVFLFRSLWNSFSHASRLGEKREDKWHIKITFYFWLGMKKYRWYQFTCTLCNHTQSHSHVVLVLSHCNGEWRTIKVHDTNRECTPNKWNFKKIVKGYKWRKT